MTATHDYDVIVIGSGPGGYVCAIRAAQLGARVAVVEKDRAGGVCLNVGCIPTKTLIRSSEVYRLVKSAGEFGVKVDGIGLDYAAAAARKDKVVSALTRGVLSLFKANGIEFIEGQAMLLGQGKVRVKTAGGSPEISAGRIIIATGSRPVEVPVAPFDGERVISSTEAVGLTSLPQRLIVVGGGYIGCEIALLMRDLDVEVCLVELMDRLLPIGDEDCSKEIFKALKRRGMDIRLGTKLEKVETGKSGVRAQLSDGKSVEGDRVLICVGRAANSAGLGLEAAGVRTDGRGVILVDDQLRTSAPNVYAIGDVTGKIQLAHVASAQGIVAAEHALGRVSARMDYRVVPSVVFTSPEVASVGLTEAQAKESVGNIKIGMFSFRGLGKAMAAGEQDGWVKVIADAGTGELLGLHIVGAHASEMIAEGAVALRLEATLHELARTIHAHPTLPEALMEAAEAALGQAIHLPPALKKTPAA